MNSQTQELEIVEDLPKQLKLIVPDEGIRSLITQRNAPDFLEIILTRKKLLSKVEKFDAVEDVNDTPRMNDAKRLRLDLVKCRTGLEAIRKKLGEEARRVVDGVNEMFRGYREENESAEEFLKESEEFAIRYEASRKAELTAERAPQLQALGVDPAMYNLGEMSVAQWEITLGGAQLAKEKADKELAEQQEREKAEREERDRLRRENEALQKQQWEIKRKQEEATRAHEAEVQRVQKEAQAKIDEERRKAQELEQKEQQRLWAEKQKEAETKKAEAKAKRAPDKQKITLIADDLERSLTQLPAMKTPEGTALAKWIATEGAKFVGLIRAKVESL